MPTVPNDPGPGTVLPQPAPGPSFSDVLGAEFRQSNTVVNTFQAIKNAGPFAPEDGFSAWDQIKDKPQYLDHAYRFAGMSSQAETDNLKAKIDQDEADRRTLAASGPMGIVAGAVSGFLDPTMLLPGRVAIGVLKDGTPLVRGALEVGGAMAVQSTAQESVLQATQPGRTAGESILNVGSATILGALLGGAAAWLSPAEHAAAVAGLDRARAEGDAHVTGQDLPRERQPPLAPAAANANEPSGPGLATAAGAAAADTRRLDLVKTGVGIEKLGLDPTLSILNQPSIAARRVYADVAELSVMVSDNLHGGTSSFGSPPLETIYRTENLGAGVALRDKLLEQWGDLAFGRNAGTMDLAKESTKKVLGIAESGEKPTFETFKTMVSDAMMFGDQHEIPQVAAAAQYTRQNFEKWADRAEKAVPDFEKLEPKEGEGYFPHRWNKPKIAAERPEFTNKITAKFAGDQATKRAAQDRIRAYQGSIEAHETTIKKLTGQLERKQEALEEDEALRDEVSRLNKFAFQRAIKLREGERPIENARGGAVFETQVRNRGNTLADRASAHAHEVEEIEDKLQAAHASAAEMRGKLEDEIGNWEGKSSGEAKSALKAREKYEAERDAARAAKGEGKLGRTASADDAVDRAVKRILASDRERDVGELRSRAHETVERILGSPDGRLSYDESSGVPSFGPSSTGEPPRGSLGSRMLDVSNDFARDWIERDIEKVQQTFNHTFIPDVLLAEKFGDVGMEVPIRRVNEEYAALIDKTGPGPERKKLEAQRQKALENIAMVRDRLRGVYNIPVTASQRRMGRVSAAVRNGMVPLNMGMAAISSLPDMAGVVFQWGMMSAFKDGYLPFVKSLMSNREYSKEALRQAKVMSIAIDTATATRHHEMSGIFDHYQPGSPAERALQWGANKFQLLNGLGPFTDFVKTISTTVNATNLYRATKAAAGGTATKKQLMELGQANIPNTLYEKIAEQYETHGTKVDGVLLPNTEAWTRETREAFESALSRNANINVVTPGLDKPGLFSDPLAAILLQFKSFTAAASTRILIANLQRADAQTLQGLIASLGVGMMSYKLNAILGGQPTSDRPQDWIKEAMSRGNVFGWLEEGNALASKATGGKADIYRLIGANKPVSRFASQDAIDQLLGPTVGKMKDMTKITSSGASGNWSAGDVKALRRMIAGQNLFYLRGLFNQVEAGADNAFGVPQKKQ